MASVTLTAADDGKTVDVSQGDSVVLRLYENAATGYRWAFDGIDRARIGAGEAEHARESDAIGSGGYTQWVLVPRKPGTIQVRLKLWRQWEGDASVRDRFSLTLDVR